jgi:hypothetical protein
VTPEIVDNVPLDARLVSGRVNETGDNATSELLPAKTQEHHESAVVHECEFQARLAACQEYVERSNTYIRQMRNELRAAVTEEATSQVLLGAISRALAMKVESPH